MAARIEATGIPRPPRTSFVSAGSKFVDYLLPAAVLAAAAGQIILLRTRLHDPSLNWMLALGGGLLLLGAVAFGLATARGPRLDSWPERTQTTPREDVSSALPQWLPALMVSLAAAGAATSVFAVVGESLIVVALWLAGMALLLIAQAKGIGRPRLQLSGVQWSYVVGVAGLLIITVLTRAWRLTSLPLNVDGDFASVGLQARAIAAGQQTRIFDFGWASIPILGYLPAWLSMLVFGTGLLGLNASGVIEGTLIVLGVFLIGRELFNARVGLLAAAVLVASYAHMAISRQSSYVDPVFTVTWAIYFLLLGMRTLRGWAIVLAGILTALSIHVYYSGRIIIPVVALCALYLLIFRRMWLFGRWKAILLFAVATLVALGPMLVLYARNPETAMSRTQQVYLFDPSVMRHMQGVYQTDSAAAVLGQQAARAALALNYFPDKGTQFALLRPLLDPVTGVLFVLGFGYLLFALRCAASWLLVWWILLVLVIGGVFTVNAPFWPRLMIVLPAIAVTCGAALDVMYERALHRLRASGRLALVVPVIAVALLGTLAVSNWSAYVHDKGTFATGRTRIARYLMDQPSTTRAYLVSDGYTCKDREFEFLIPGRLVGALTAEQAEQPIAAAGSPTLLIVTPDHQDLAQRLTAKYAGGPVPGNTPTEVAFYVFKLP